MPTVSVVLTSYNHEKYIGQAIESVLNQTYQDFELIIVDDCSTDDSAEIIKHYKDSRIKVIEHDKNMGRCITPQLVNQTLCGNYVAIHHSDDVWKIDKLQKQVHFLEQHKEYAACFTNVEFIDESGEELILSDEHVYKGIFDKKNRGRFEWLNYFFYKGNCLCHPSVLIRRSAYKECNLLDTKGIAQLPDFLQWIRLCIKKEIYVMNEKLVRFRINQKKNSNMSADKLDVRIRLGIENYILLKEYRRISNKNEFIKVFPEAKKYFTSGDGLTDYAFARICLEENLQSHNLFAIELLVELLNNETSANKLEELYEFKHKDAVELTRIYDVFNVSRFYEYINASIYLDYGDGFNEYNKITKRTYVKSSGEFCVQYNVESVLEKKHIDFIRFDPDEGRIWEIKIESVEVDGKLINAFPFNSLLNYDGYDVFMTTDPIYMSSLAESCSSITIMGTLRPLSEKVIYDFVHQIQKNDNENLLKLRSVEEENRVYIEKIKVISAGWSEEKEKIKVISAGWSEEKEKLTWVSTEYDNYKINCQAVIHEKNLHIEELYLSTEKIKNEKEFFREELANIYSSRSWKLICLFRKIKKHILHR